LRLAARPEHCQKRAATIASNCVFVNLYLFGPAHTLYCKVCRGDHFYPKIACPINFFPSISFVFVTCNHQSVPHHASRRASAGKCKTDNSHVAAESVVDDEPVPTAFKEVAAAAASSLDEKPASGGLLAAGIQLIQEGMILACSARLSRVPNLRTLSARGTCIDLPSPHVIAAPQTSLQ
jgi:hypothetical protein